MDRPARSGRRGDGSVRERKPGVWEIRIVVGHDTITGRSIQRSFTVHGDVAAAEKRRRELVDQYGVTRVAWSTAGARMTLGDLVQKFCDAPHLWKPATYTSHRSVVQQLIADPLAKERLVTLTPGEVLAAIGRWQAVGASIPTVSARWLVLHSALSWAVRENLLRTNPLTGVRGPPRPKPRRLLDNRP
jgi:hypothetical protein